MKRACVAVFMLTICNNICSDPVYALRDQRVTIL
jgi:hypothetical protein